MNRPASHRPLWRDRLGQAGIAAGLLVLCGLALAGPSGLFAWSEQRALLERREARIAALEAEQAEISNRVDLLDGDHADPDLVTELLRRDLNVAHPDEYVVEIDPNE